MPHPSKFSILICTLFIWSLVASCDTKKPVINTEVGRQTPNTSPRCDTIINQFVNEVFCKEINSKLLHTIFSNSIKITKQPIENKYEPIIDTIFTIKEGNSEARFYKAKDKLLFHTMDVRSSQFIKLCYGIDVGMDKKSFLKALEINANASNDSDTIKVYNNEMEGDFTIFFKKSKIVRLLIRDTME